VVGEKLNFKMVKQ